MKPKTKLIGFVFGIMILCLKPLLIQYNMTWFYNKFSWVVVLSTLFFASSLIVEIFRWIKEKYDQWSINKNYQDYIIELSGEKLEIVRKLYNAPHHQGYLRQNDTNVIELYNKYVIVQLSNQVVVKERYVEDINDPEFLFVLQPAALHVIEKNPKKFR